MDWKKVHYNSFGSQKAVDECVLEAERLAEKCNNEETAIQLLKRIESLKTVEQIYFVPEIVLSWEEMALSYIESQYAVFDYVHYPQIKDIYRRGLEAFTQLENNAKNKLLPEEVLFGMIRGFNMDVQFFNKFCRQHSKESLPPYTCKDPQLHRKYLTWKKEATNEP